MIYPSISGAACLALMSTINLMVCGGVSAQTPKTSVGEFIAAIRTAEETQLSQVVEYRCNYRFARTRTPFNPATAGEWDGRQFESLVRFDGSRHRYFAQMRSTTGGSQRVGDTIKKVSVGAFQEYSNDGAVFRHWRRDRIDGAPPDRDDAGLAGNGVISKAEDETEHVQHQGFSRVHAVYAGMGWLPPYLFIRGEPVRLSAVLEDAVRLNRPLKITPRIDGDRLDISVRYSTLDGIAEKYSETDLSIVFHLPSGLWENYESRFLDDKATLRHKILVEMRGVGSEAVPARIVWLDEAYLRSYEYLEFKRFPSIDANTFALKFPNGIEVMDHLNGMYFTTGTGIVDEQAAIRAFRERNGFRLERLPSSSGVKWWYWGVGIFVLVSIAGIIMRLRWQRMLAVLIVTQVLSAMPCQAEHSLEQLRDGTWVADYGTGERVPIIQCGLRVTMFVLDCAEVDYRVSAVSQSLKPDTRGSTLLEIRDVLRAHGLSVEGRKDVTKIQMKKWLSPNRLAIIPIPITRDEKSGDARQLHYVVAMLDSTQKPVLVNVPQRVIPFDAAINESGLTDAGGYVLLVEHGADEFRKAKGLRLKSGHAVLDVGDITLDSESTKSEPITRIVTVENPNPFPVIVTDVRASCGCFTVKWPGGLVGAKASVELPVVVVPAAWALGENTKSLALKCHGLGDFVVTVRGNGISREHKPAVFRIFPGSHELEFDHVSGGDRIALGSLVETTAVLADAVTAESSVDWLRPSLTRLNDYRQHLTIEVALTPELLSSLKKGQVIEEAVVRVSQKTPPHEGRVTVRLSPRRHFSSEPPTVILTNSSEGALVVLRPVEKDSAMVWRLTGISSPQGRFEFVRQSENELAFHVKRTSETQAGVHRVDCSLKSDDGDEFIHRVVVSVP